MAPCSSEIGQAEAASPSALSVLPRAMRRRSAVGDAAPVGEGVSEMRLHFGPGCQLYCVQRGEDLVILLCRGNKSTQAKNIENAKKIARTL